MNLGLPPGNWRYDPHRRCQVWVPLDPHAEISDAFNDAPSRFRKADTHGTEHAARLHRERGTEVCDECREAVNANARRRRANRRNQAA